MSYANYPIIQQEHPGVERARGIMGATMRHIRPELNRAPISAQFSDTVQRTANYKIPLDMPDAVEVPTDLLIDPLQTSVLSFKNNETRLATGLPVFFDRESFRTLQNRDLTPLVSLSGLNQKLMQICNAFQPGRERDGLKALLRHKMDRFVFAGTQLSFETEGSGHVRRMLAAGISGLSFIGDMFRQCYDYFTPITTRRAVQNSGAPNTARNPIPLDPYQQGNVLGLVTVLVPKKWVTDPRVSARSIQDVLAGEKYADDELCIQVFPWCSYNPQIPSDEDVYGPQVAAALREKMGNPTVEVPIDYVRIGTVASTYLDSAADGGVGFDHAAIFPGAQPTRPYVTAEEPVRVYLEPRGPSLLYGVSAKPTATPTRTPTRTPFSSGAQEDEAEDGRTFTASAEDNGVPYSRRTPMSAAGAALSALGVEEEEER